MWFRDSHLFQGNLDFNIGIWSVLLIFWACIILMFYIHNILHIFMSFYRNKVEPGLAKGPWNSESIYGGPLKTQLAPCGKSTLLDRNRDPAQNQTRFLYMCPYVF